MPWQVRSKSKGVNILKYAITTILAFVLGSYCGITQAQENQTKFNPTAIPGGVVVFSEIEQYKLLNAFRKAQTSGKTYDEANCLVLANSANGDATEYNNLKAQILKAHGLDPNREIVLNLKEDKASPAPVPPKEIKK